VTTHAHLLEVYSTLDSRPEIKNADEILQTLLQFAIPIPDSAVRPAAEIRRKLRALRRDCSYVDALGYGVANALRIPLLIADDSFRDLKGVIWIPLPAKR
jgi:predicted nucleic acid-binding protein